MKALYNISTEAREIQYLTYRKFILLPRIQSIVQEYVQEKNICFNYAIHVRRTDLHDELTKSNKQMSFAAIFKTIEKQFDSNKTIFLAADSYETQDMFLQKYGRRILMYKRIDAAMIRSKIGNKAVYTSETRQTTLEVAVIDAYITSYALRAKYTLYSSFSEWIVTLRQLRVFQKGLPACPSKMHHAANSQTAL